jgi:hypothetical protein
MLSNAHFYYQLTRKYVVIFGNMFNNISIIRTDKDTGEELERIKVPLTYGPKEKYVVRLEQDPDLQKEVAIVLPRMAYEMTGMNYDAARKQNSLLRQAKGDNESRVKSQYMGVPYNFEFELSVYTKSMDDMNHILEQIYPYFNPDYTVTINPVPEVGFLKDIPIILNTVATNTMYEGNYDAVRYVQSTLSFTVKGYFYGPVSTPKIIRKVITNIFNDRSLSTGYVTKINTEQGNDGVFKVDDTVYQGESYQSATAYGIVLSWSPNNAKLMLGGVQGQFKVGKDIRAMSSNAVYKIASFDAEPIKLAQITIEPDPIDAEPEDDFGYTTTIKEFPDTL